MLLNQLSISNFELFSNLQGNILKGHGRSHTANIFIRCLPGQENNVKKWISGLTESGYITSTLQQLRDTLKFKNNKVDGGLFACLLFTAKGYQYLGLDVTKFEPSFKNGMGAADLKDPVQSKWENGFTGEIHFMLLIADADKLKLADEVKKAKEAVAHFGNITTIEYGNAVRNGDGAGIEHFGYVDGISQPLFFKDELEVFTGQNGIDDDNPMEFNPAAETSLVLISDPLEPADEGAMGSYFVFRKLEQDVSGFKNAEKAMAQELGLKGEDQERAGAMIVGRFEDGTPVELSDEAGLINSYVQNNFNYDKNDASRCPFHAHIRKSNPRNDLADSNTHTMARRGIPFGEREDDPNDGNLENKPTGGVGLLFMSYQASIANQFEVIQKNWVNNPTFPTGAATDPPGKSGIDPLIGQGDRSDKGSYPVIWDKKDNSNFKRAGLDPFVTMKGGEYFFAPSLSFLKRL